MLTPQMRLTRVDYCSTSSPSPLTVVVPLPLRRLLSSKFKSSPCARGRAWRRCDISCLSLFIFVDGWNHKATHKGELRIRRRMQGRIHLEMWDEAGLLCNFKRWYRSVCGSRTRRCRCLLPVCDLTFKLDKLIIEDDKCCATE